MSKPPGRGGRVGLVAARSTREADGIRDYTHLLLTALRDAGVEAELFEWAGGALQGTNGQPQSDVPAELASMDAVVVQYNPFAYGRWGFAPKLPLFLAALRRGRPRPRIAVMFHETYVDMYSFSWALMGAWQRVQLVAVQATCDVQLCSSQSYMESVRRTAFGRAVHHLPVASNLPDARANRDEARSWLGVDHDVFVLSCMGLCHPQRLQSYAPAAAQAAGKVARSVLLLNLGPGERSVERIEDNVFVRHTGFMDARAVARHFAASDVFLAPYMDGVSTRRGSVMAALQHGVTVVGTASDDTDDVLREPGLVLVDLGSRDRFARAAMELASDVPRCAELGSMARSLYEQQFDWPVLTNRLRRHIDV